MRERSGNGSNGVPERAVALAGEEPHENPASYVAVGLALNHALGTPRFSRDIDIFHDSREAMLRSWEADWATLRAAGCTMKSLRELNSVQAPEVRFDPSDPEASLVRFCRERRSRGDLLRFTGLTNSYLMSKYVYLLVKANRLYLSIPTKPKSEKQQFSSIPL